MKEKVYISLNFINWYWWWCSGYTYISRAGV